VNSVESRQFIDGVTVAVATYQSAAFIQEWLASVRIQTLQSPMQILAIDGGSTDGTLEILKEQGIATFTNPRKEPVYAKFLALNNAAYRYLVFLDHDERFCDSGHLQKKLQIMKGLSWPLVLSSGYKTNVADGAANTYLSAFGDPFSAFYYGISFSNGLFVRQLCKFALRVESTATACSITLKPGFIPLIETASAGILIDRAAIHDLIPASFVEPEKLPLLYYLLPEKFRKIVIAVQTPVLHRSSETWVKYLAKVRWRIRNNIYFKDSLGKAGFTGRVKNQPFRMRVKSYLFLSYTVSVVGPLYHAIKWSILERKKALLHHIWLAPWTAYYILAEVVAKGCGIKRKLTTYDGKSQVTPR